ncbi:MAG: DNA internalization-related competence protein ComEC/Rec2 [Zoogloeaceae bacterium]|nr:DNA internalization-related competence protein ComEC/Rec2 [Zoogloeaceae bacterium]
MLMSIVGGLAGIWLLQCQSGLPAGREMAGLVVAGALAAGLAWRLRRAGRHAGWIWALTAGILLGFSWAAWRADLRLGDALAPDLEGRDLILVGVIADLPQDTERGQRFSWAVDNPPLGVPSRVMIAWYEREEDGAEPSIPLFRAGERWRLRVRLKRPHGVRNPGGFDFEAWLLEGGVRATGYIRPAGVLERLDSFVVTPGTVVARLREVLRARLRRDLADSAYPGIALALTVGEQRAIDSDLWRLFNRTGIQHLMAISGLHVGMVGVLVGGLVGYGWRRVAGLALRCPAQHAAAVAGMAAALAYGALAGMGVPTQRTVLMLAVVSLAIVSGRRASATRMLALALAVVLVADPWAVLAPGFWLSFGAVAILLLAAAGRLVPDGWWRGFWRSQWAVTLGLLPALLALFQQFSLVSPLANAVAIPLVSLVVTPLLLVGMLIPFPPLFALSDQLLIGLVAFLEWLAAWPWAVWQQPEAPGWLVVLALGGVTWGLLPRGLPGRIVGWLALLPLLAWAPPRPPPGAWRMTVLDVGQGLAVHVQTASHDLLYDAGPAWGGEADSGVRVVLPYLRATGVSRLDRMVISHDDVDHSGGAASVAADRSIGSWITSLPAGHPIIGLAGRHESCAAGQRWEWDGVAFEVLHPRGERPSGAGAQDNARSCVLQIASPVGRALLLGDLEAAQEADLVMRLGSGVLASDVVVAPHHGSRSSSSPALVAATAPSEVVYSAGYRNRFHHPHPQVVARWEEAGAQGWRTDRDGAVRIDAGPMGLKVTAFREAERRYWHGR